MESPDDGDVDDSKHNNNSNNNYNDNNNNNNNNNSYNESVKTFIKYKMSSDPGYFAKGLEQRHYELCQVCPLRRQRQRQEEEEEEIEQIKNTSSSSSLLLLSSLAVGVPILVLPLRINLIRSTILGCSQSLNINSIKSIVKQINIRYWIKQAGIQFNLIDVKERYCTLGPTIENDIQHFITHQLKRGTDGKMMYKKERRHKFCNVLLSSFLDNNNSNNKNNKNDLLETTSNIYDIWFIDMVGQQSQGQCIDRTSRTIIMGERSTKGYNEPTKRPHDCIAKTAAHELGHALLLNHPQKGMKFDDGRNQILSSASSSSSSKSKSKYNNKDNSNSNKNLMSGGSDIKGGGGSYLEQWQCSIAREAAQIFINKHR